MQLQDTTITATDVMALLRVSRITVSRMARDGRLTPVRTRPFYLFDRAEIELLAAERSAA